jgi:hypothetical protein
MQARLEDGKSESTINNTLCAAVADHFRYGATHPTRDPLIADTKKLVAQRSPAPKKRKKAELGLFTRLNAYMVSKPLESSDLQFLIRLRDYCMLLHVYMVMTRPEATVRLLEVDYSTVMIPTNAGEETALQIYSRDGKTNLGGPPHVALITARPEGARELNLPFWLKTYTDMEATVRQLKGIPVRPATMFYNLTTKAFGRQLAPSTITSSFKRHTKAAGIPAEGITAYSFRVLGVSEAIRQKVAMHIIKRHGNWKSDAVYSYLCDTDDERLETSRALRGGV